MTDQAANPEPSERSTVRLPERQASPPVMSSTASTVAGFVLGNSQDEAIALLTHEEGALRRVMQRYVRDASTVDDIYQ
jgi:hypothetical protein